MEMPKSLKEWSWTILLIIFIIVFLMIATNQVIEYFYKIKFISTPCEMCCTKEPYFECPKPRIINISMPQIEGAVK